MTQAVRSSPPPETGEEMLPPLPRAVAAFAFLMVAEFFYSWAWYSVDVLRPFVRDALHLTLTEAGSGYTAQGAGALIGAVLVGQLADRVGRRAMLSVVMIGYGLGLLSGVVVASYPQYLAQRFVLGLFLGGIFPVVVGIYVGLFRSNVRGRLASLIYSVASLGVVMQGLALTRIEPQDWKLLLWIGGVPPVLLAVVVWRIIPATAAPARHRGAAKLPVMELFAPAVKRRTLALVSLTGLNFFGYQAFSGWLTTYLRDSQHLAPAAVGSIVAGVSTANLVGGLFWGWTNDRFGRRFNAIGFVLTAAVIAVFVSLPADPRWLGALGLAYGFAVAASVAWGPWLTELYPPHLKSTAASIFNWGRIVSMFAPIVTGALAGSFGLAAAMLSGCAVFLMAALIWLTLPETHPAPLRLGRGQGA
ncbi:MFS transporter [Sphingomonas sp. CL5.1]|uniref:MFS transporter n=1 Tax=Sphingomonas sp. CL5.1 TaxID=2653203 RepID=UPI001581E543|nr:MFS transporter [Sphingomonas sp. CL5.1]QKR99762.1 MFS transporter [Sphingomonas sp. CL5.1]